MGRFDDSTCEKCGIAMCGPPNNLLGAHIQSRLAFKRTTKCGTFLVTWWQLFKIDGCVLKCSTIVFIAAIHISIKVLNFESVVVWSHAAESPLFQGQGLVIWYYRPAWWRWWWCSWRWRWGWHFSTAACGRWCEITGQPGQASIVMVLSVCALLFVLVLEISFK